MKSLTRRCRQLFVLGVVCLILSMSARPIHAAKEPKKRVAVVEFENKATYSARGMGHLGQGMAEKLVDELIGTGKFIVLERIALDDVIHEQHLDRYAPVSPEIKARLTVAQALIRGVVTDVRVTGKGDGGLRIGKFKIGARGQKVEVQINLRIIDTVTGQILESTTVIGIARKKGINLIANTKKIGAKLGLEQDIPLGKAADKAVAKAVAKIVAGMESFPWQGSIARVSGREIFINAGRQENVEPGLRLRVFEKGADIIDLETNINLGSRDEEIGIVEVETVQGRFSVAKIIEGQGFSAGNLVRPDERPVGPGGEVGWE